VNWMKETRYVHRTFVIKHLGKRSIREPRRVCLENVTMIRIRVARYVDGNGPGSYALVGIHIKGIRTSAFVTRNSVTTILRRQHIHRPITPSKTRDLIRKEYPEPL
jgi:hypothetical protein